MEMRTNEYVVFSVVTHGNGMYHHTAVTDPKSGKERLSPWYGTIPYTLTYPSKEAAIAKAEQLIADNIFQGPVTVTDEDTNIYRVAWDNMGRNMAVVKEIPLGHKIGYRYAEMLSMLDEDRYTDEKPCQLMASTADTGMSYLRWNGKDDYDWVHDNWSASFFTEDRAKELQSWLNELDRKSAKHKGYVLIHDLPLRLTTKPELKKGDKVIVWSTNDTIPYTSVYPAYDCEIDDIVVRRNNKGEKEYRYIIGSPCPAADGLEMSRAELHTREQLKSAGASFYRGYFNGRPNEEHMTLRNFTFLVY